jgi:hypothetical protein
VKEKPQPLSGFLRFCRPKKEAMVKKQKVVKKELAPEVKKEELWWEEELELQALLVRHPDDPADKPDQRLLEARSFNKVQPMDNDTPSCGRPWTEATSSTWLTTGTTSRRAVAVTAATSLL